MLNAKLLIREGFTIHEKSIPFDFFIRTQTIKTTGNNNVRTILLHERLNYVSYGSGRSKSCVTFQKHEVSHLLDPYLHLPHIRLLHHSCSLTGRHSHF